MLDKRYQVFVSSTSIDLREERQIVINALLEASYIPVGMELFSAATEKSWPVIKRLIDGCDYYVVIVAGRYGYQFRETRKSFTQSEYEYARRINKRRLAFLHRYPDRLIVEGPKQTKAASQRLKAFRSMLEGDLLVKYWDQGGYELAGKVVNSLNNETQDHPEVGWVRGDSLTAITAEAAASGIQSTEFETRADFWLYAAKRIEESRSIYDLTWGQVYPTTETHRDQNAYRTYREAIWAAATDKGQNSGKMYREIMSFPDTVRLDRAAPLLDNEKYPNFQLKCFDYDHEGTPPLIQFYVFDKKEVLISLTPLTGSAIDSRYMTFKGEKIASLMSAYFEAAWRDAIVLKDLAGIRWSVLRDIAHRLGSDIFDNTSTTDDGIREVP